MDKIEEKMARFVELSVKFTVVADAIDEITDLKELMEPEDNSSGIVLTATGRGDLWQGHAVPTPDSLDGRVEKKSERERVEEGVTRRWRVYEEYKEYLKLQETLGDYFRAKDKV